jgi:hypothetical protein
MVCCGNFRNSFGEHDSLVNGYLLCTQTLNGCESDRTAVAVTVLTIPAPTGAPLQTFVTGQTIYDIVVTTGANVVWYASESDAIAGTNALTGSTILVNNTTYYATQTVSNCVSIASLAVTVTATLATDGFDMSTFVYYPNPVSSMLNISYSQDLISVKVCNVIGQEIDSRNIYAKATQIDLSAYSSGTYFIKVTTANATKTFKVIKK